MRAAIEDAQYGSDKAGLVCAYRFEPDDRGRQIEPDAAAAWIAAQPTHGFLWLHFSLANAASEPWLRLNIALPPAFFESLKEVASTVTFYIAPRVAVSARTTALRAVNRLTKIGSFPGGGRAARR